MIPIGNYIINDFNHHNVGDDDDLPPLESELLEAAVKTKNAAEVQKILQEQKPTGDDFQMLAKEMPALAHTALEMHPTVAQDLKYSHITRLLIETKDEVLFCKLIDCGMNLDHGIHLPYVYQAIQFGHLQTAHKLLDAGAPFVGECWLRRDTALHQAVMKKAVPLIERLVALGADVTQKDKNGKSPLDLASESNDPAVIGAIHGGLKIHDALKKVDKAKVAELLAKKEHLSPEGCKALWQQFPDLAFSSLTAYPGLVGYVKYAPYSFIEPFFADDTKEEELFRFVKQGAEIPPYEFLQASRAYPERMGRLLDAKPDIAKTCNAIMLEALFAEPDCEALVIKLIKNGAELESRHILSALARGLLKIADELLKATAALPLMVDHHKMSALHYAVQRGNTDYDFIRRMMSLHCDSLLFLKNRDGHTPRELARELGDESIVTQLLNWELQVSLTSKNRERVEALLAENYMITNSNFLKLAELFPELALNHLSFTLANELLKADIKALCCDVKYSAILEKLMGYGIVLPLHFVPDLLASNLPAVAERCIRQVSSFDDKAVASQLLEAAASGGHLTALQLLLERGVDPLCNTPILRAIDNGHKECVKALIIAASPSSLEKRTLETFLADSLDPFVKVVGYGQASAEEFYDLCTRFSQLMYKVVCRFPTLAEICTSEAFDLLLDASDNDDLLISICTYNTQVAGKYTLTTALCKNRLAVALALIEQEAPATEADDEGMTPLHYAAKLGHFEIVNKLIAKGVPLFVKNKQGQTPSMLVGDHPELRATLGSAELHAAIGKADAEGVQALLALNIPVGWASFALMCEKLPDIAKGLATKELLQKLPEHTLPKLIVKKECDALLSTLIGLEFTLKDEQVYDVFHNGLKESCLAILARGVDVTCLSKDGQSLLLAVAQHPHFVDVVKKLLELGADPFYGAGVGKITPLRKAFTAVNYELVGILVANLPETMKAYMAGTTPIISVKERCQKDPRFVLECCTDETTPLEAAILFQDAPLAQTIMRKLPERLQLQGIEILCKRYPKSIPSILDFFFSVDEQHMFVGNISMVTTLPPATQERDLDVLCTYLTEQLIKVCEKDEKLHLDGQSYNVEKVSRGVKQYFSTIKERPEFTGTPPKDKPAFKEQYDYVQNVLIALVTYLEGKETNPLHARNVKDICVHLAAGSGACFIQYRETALSLYNKYLLEVDPNMGNAVLLQLQLLRGTIIEGIMNKEPYVNTYGTVHSIQYFKRVLGEPLQLADRALYAEELPTEGSGFNGWVLPSVETLKQSFFKHYRPSAVYDCIRSYLQEQTAKKAYLDWCKKELKEYIPGYEAYKASKAALQKKRKKEELLASLKEQMLYLPKGFTPVEALEDSRAGDVNAWLLDENTGAANPFGIILMLMKQQALTFKVA